MVAGSIMPSLLSWHAADDKRNAGQSLSRTAAHHEGGHAVLKVAQQLRQVIDAADSVFGDAENLGIAVGLDRGFGGA
jgi:hypothetical protein